MIITKNPTPRYRVAPLDQGREKEKTRDIMYRLIMFPLSLAKERGKG